MRKIRLGIVLSAALALTWTAGCHSAEKQKTGPVETVDARLVQSVAQQAPTEIRATGTLHARQSAMLSAQVVGRVLQVLVREGDAVRAGQTLAVLDDATERAGMDQASAAAKAAESQQAAAQADATLAASTLARYKQLQAEKSVSPQEMDEMSQRATSATQRLQALREQVKAARAQEASAQAMLGYTHLRAPFAGVITARLADPGALASPGVPLLQIDQAGPLQLEVTVDESAIGLVHRGMKVPVTLDGAGAANLTGVVAEILPAADPTSHTFLVKIDLGSSSTLRAGMYGSAAIAAGAHSAILVPRSAVVQRGSLSCAYVRNTNGIADLRYVTLGSVHGAQVEVLSGIAAGETLVDEPGDRDLAGKRIASQSGTVQSGEAQQ
ncbi:MAG TPA: efflux RND transporter periplasmic adaptor subunit [Terracidiphilus sp.]|nr:efflux RND transporter periplasmic adaptor subunit [Terracidiphilus sp.]